MRLTSFESKAGKEEQAVLYAGGH